MARQKGDYDVVLLGTGRDGYGDAKDQGRESYAWAINFDGGSGRFVPAAAYTRVLAQTTFSPVRFLSEWENAAGDPILIWTGGDVDGNATIFEWENATLTVEDLDIPFFTAGILSRFDQDTNEDPDEEMMFFCNGSGEDVIVRRKKDGSTDTGNTGGGAAHTAKADLIAVVGADIYRVLTYKIGKLTPRADPGIVGSYPTDAASVPAGRPAYPINAVLNLGASPFIITGQGVFKFNPAPAAAVFGTILEFRSPHPDNGKASITDGRGRLYVDTAQGHLVVITFGFQQTQQPDKDTYFDRDTPGGKISAMAVDLDHPYVAFEPGTKGRTQAGVGLYVQSENNGQFTNHTSNVTNRTFNSVASIVLLGASDDYILIGTTEPNMGTYMELAGVRDTETPATAAMTVEYSSGTDAWTSATIMDSTLEFAQSGLISMHNGFQHPFDHDTKWTSFASAADTNNIDRYWMRIKPGGTLTGVTIREVHVLPYRPPLTGDANVPTDAARMAGYKVAGALPSISKGTWRGEKIVWHDWITMWTSKIEKMVIGRVNDAVTDSESALYAVTHDGLYAIPVGPDGDPVRASYPNLGHANTLAAGLNDHLVAGSINDFGLPYTVTVDAAIVKGKHLQSDDEFYIWYRAEHEPEWHQEGPSAKFPIVIKDLGTGKAFQVIAGFKDGSRSAIAPQIDSITVPRGHWTYEADELVDEPEQDTQSPQQS